MEAEIFSIRTCAWYKIAFLSFISTRNALLILLVLRLSIRYNILWNTILQTTQVQVFKKQKQKKNEPKITIFNSMLFQLVFKVHRIVRNCMKLTNPRKLESPFDSSNK